MASKIGARKGTATPRTPGRGEGKERSSPLSPTRLSRLQEKEELQSLNDRLAAYIDRVRHLELENSRLTVQVETIQESVSKEVTTMKNLYEGELTDARRLLDDTAKEKAALQIDVGKLRSTNEDLRLKLAKKERELANAEKSLTTAEGQVADLTAKLNTSEAERKKLLGELRDLKEEVGRLALKLSEAKQQLESETLMRVDLENRCQSLREELQFKHQVYEQEVSETKKRKQVEISEIDGKLQTEYEQRLANSLQALRADYEEQMKGNRAELEDLYQTKIEEMTRREQQTSDESNHLSSVLKKAKQEVSELTSRLSYLEGTNHTLQQRINDLEQQLDSERNSHGQETKRLRAEIERLCAEMSVQLQEYRDLMDIKVALDMEIAAYRKLLEAEEERLNISVGSVKASSGSASSSATSRRLQTPTRSGKRKRQDDDDDEEGGEVKQSTTSSSSFSSSFKSSASSSGPLQIAEDCPKGQFVKIVNTADKDVALGGYQIIRQVTGGEQVTYKFHSKSKVAPYGEVTVWSCDLNVAHSPPSTIVMRNQKWPSGDAVVTKLVTSSQEIATRETKRETESYSSYSERELPEPKRLATGTSPEKCVVM